MTVAGWEWRFVFRNEINGYYDNIDHTLIVRQLDRAVSERNVMRLLTQVICRSVEWGVTFCEMRRGIGRGS